MDWWQFIFILVMIPSDSMANKKKRFSYPEPMIPKRRFLDYDQNDPEQVMQALNSLPGPDHINQVDMAEYAQIEKARIEKQRQKYPQLQGKRLPYENFDMNKINQSAVYYLPKINYFKKYYNYYYNQYNNNNNNNYYTTPTPTYYRKMSEYIKRRHHYDKGALKTIHDIESIPDIEAMLPPDYLAKHPHDFHRFHASTGKKVEKFKNPYHNIKEPATQYAEMGSMKKFRKSSIDSLVKPQLTNKRDTRTADDGISLHGITFRKSDNDDIVERNARAEQNMKYLQRSRKAFEDSLARALFQQTHVKKSVISPYFRNIPAFRKSNIDDRVEAYLSKKRNRGANNARRYFSHRVLPSLTKEQVNHPGNSLFYITDKRILGAHIFPKKEAQHSLYGNWESLGLNVQPTSEELKLKRIKKIYRETAPDAQDRPWRLYNRNHPGLNLLFEKKMPLDAAKFTKPKKYLVYGNLDNLQRREKDSDLYAFSDFRRSQNFKRPDSGKFNIRPARQKNTGQEEIDTHHSRKPRKQKGGWTRPGRKIEPYNEVKKKPKVIARIYIARSGAPSPPILRVGKIPRPAKPRRKKKTTPRGEKKETQKKKLPAQSDETGTSKKKKKVLKKEKKIQLNHEFTDNKEESKKLVYGNIENDMLGIRYDKTPFRWKYTDFRKNNENRKRPSFYKTINRHYREVSDEDSEIYSKTQDEDSKNSKVIIVQQDENSDIEPETLSALKRLIEKRNVKYGQTSNGIAVLPVDLDQKYIKYRFLKDYLGGNANEDQNDSDEIVDTYEDDFNRWRRSSKGRYKYASYEKKDNNTPCDNDDTSSSSKSGEKNPGNPYTIFKSKYKQNWLWNHFMDGDHMNVNPYGPKFDSLGPTGNELFFGRKWWYFNQDDYKPFRRR